MTSVSTLTDLQRRKIDKRFALMDTDHNGYIDKSDYDPLVQRILAQYGLEPDSPDAAELSAGYSRMWTGLAGWTDTNADGQVSREEFRTAIAEGILGRANGFERVIRPTTQAVLRVADTDRDGKLSLPEFIELAAVFGVDDAEATAFFRMADRDGDNDLTVDEIPAADQEFYLSDDPRAVGNLLFGNV